MGIIDTLSAGFSAVNRRLWVVLIPVFLDLFLWLGPKLTAAGPVKRFFDFYADLAARSSSEVAGQASTATQLAQMGEQFRQMNFFDFLAWQTPSLMYSQLTEQPAGLFSMPVFSVDRGLVLVGLILGIALLSLLIQSAYLGSITHAIRIGKPGLKFLVSRVALNWVRLIAYFALIAVGVIFVGTPILGMAALIGLISQGVASLIFGLLVAVGMWFALYLFFAVAAMFVSDVGPLRGSWYSFNIVRRYFWSALGLIALIMVIRFGMSRVWGLVMGNPAGVTTAILGNAYIDAGLAAASLIYYRDRYTKWRGSSEYSTALEQKP